MKKYFRLIWLEFKKGKEYSLNFIGEIVYLPLKLLIIYFIWKYVFSQVSSIENYSFIDLVVYYFLLEILQNAITPVGITAYEVWTDINEGRINLFLSRPIYYPLYLIFSKIGSFIWGLFSGLIFVILFQIFVGVNVQFNLVEIVFSIQSAFLGLLIMFGLFFCVGALTFWVENILSLRDNLWNVIRILSGQILPIAFFPFFFRRIAENLPFQYIYYIPISIFQGKMHGIELSKILLNQFLWVVILLLLSVFLWHSGTRRYTSQGG